MVEVFIYTGMGTTSTNLKVVHRALCVEAAVLTRPETAKLWCRRLNSLSSD